MCGFEIWPVSTREEQSLRVLKNRVLRRLFILRNMEYHEAVKTANEKIVGIFILMHCKMFLIKCVLNSSNEGAHP